MRRRIMSERDKSSKAEALPRHRESRSQVTRGGFWRVAARVAKGATNTTSDLLVRTGSLSFRLVCDAETRRVRRGGDYYDEASWVHRNVPTKGAYAGRGGMPGIRLARGFVW
jgi:hypothetical protein